MPKFTKSERERLKSLVRIYSILKMRDSEIIANIRNESGMDISQSTLTRIKLGLRKGSMRWYNNILSKRYEFMSLVKENWDSLSELKRLVLENYSEAKESKNIGEKRKNLELLLKIEEDVARYIDALQFIGHTPSLLNERIFQSPTMTNIKVEGDRHQVPF